MKYTFLRDKTVGSISRMIYGHFIEHFHRQIYGGVYDPDNPLSDADGLRTDVLNAMRDIGVSVLRWPGGCFVSSYHWQDGVGKNRRPSFDKAWRVEEPNTFGTDEYIGMCRKIGCEPYICTNAGTGTAEEMSDWVEYCNLDGEGRYARLRAENGHAEPHAVKYWSIGNENYGAWEIGAKGAGEWGALVAEAAKMMRRADPRAELSAAALADIDWNVSLLKAAGKYLKWISIHGYWDPICETNACADYSACMAYTDDIGESVRKVRGLLDAMGLKHVKIAFDEWNLRQWYHPKALSFELGLTKDEYLLPRDKNDINSQYTMADAVFTACFLNMCARNCDIVGMANFAPIVNTRGCIYTYKDGIVLRGTYYVFLLYTRYLGDIALDGWAEAGERMTVTDRNGAEKSVEVADVLATYDSKNGQYAVAVVNKSAESDMTVDLGVIGGGVSRYRIITVNGSSADAYNDVGHEDITLREGEWRDIESGAYTVAPHSVNIIQLK